MNHRSPNQSSYRGEFLPNKLSTMRGVRGESYSEERKAMNSTKKLGDIDIPQGKRKNRAIKRALIKDFLDRRDQENTAIASSMTSEKFYRSKRWLEMRYLILKKQGNLCKACGRGPKQGAVIQVDHIYPRYIFPELAFDPANLQVLCSDCNTGKGVKDKTKW